MATTTASGRSPTWPLFLSHTNVDARAGILRRLERYRSSVSCSTSNSNSAPALRTGIGTGRGTETATAKETEREGACWSGGNTEHENEAEYEEGDCECDCKRPCDCDSGCECGCECKTGNPVGKGDIKPTSKTACVCARSLHSIRAERRRQRQRQRQGPASPTTAASIAAQRQHQHQHQHQQVQNPSLQPAQPAQPPPQNAHQPSMPPPPRFASCGHSPPPFPALPSPSSTTTSQSLSGYCRPCDFTNTRRTIVRICEHYEEQIADLETRIEKAKVELFRTWNDYLGERKDMAIRAVERLKEIKEEECQGAWREFDERWGGKAVGGGGA